MGLFKKLSQKEIDNKPEAVWSKPKVDDVLPKTLKVDDKEVEKAQEVFNNKWDGGNRCPIKELAEACYNLAFGKFDPDDVRKSDKNKVPGVSIYDSGLGFSGRTNGLSDHGVFVTESGDVHYSYTSGKSNGRGYNGCDLVFTSNGDGTVSFDEYRSWREGPHTLNFESLVSRVNENVGVKDNKTGMFDDFIYNNNLDVKIPDFKTNESYFPKSMKQACYNVLCRVSKSAGIPLGDANGYKWCGCGDGDRKYELLVTDTGFEVSGVQERELKPTRFSVDFAYASDDVEKKGNVKCVGKTSTGKFEDVDFLNGFMDAVKEEYTNVHREYAKQLADEFVIEQSTQSQDVDGPDF